MSIWHKIKSLLIIGLANCFCGTIKSIEVQYLKITIKHDETNRKNPYSVQIHFKAPFGRRTNEFKFLLITWWLTTSGLEIDIKKCNLSNLEILVGRIAETPRFILLVLDTSPPAGQYPILERIDVDDIKTLTIQDIKLSNPWNEWGTLAETAMILDFKVENGQYAKVFTNGDLEHYATVFLKLKTNDAILYDRQESYVSRTYYYPDYNEAWRTGASGYLINDTNRQDALTYWFTKGMQEEKTINTSNGTFTLSFDGSSTPLINYARKSKIGRRINPSQIEWKTFSRNEQSFLGEV